MVKKLDLLLVNVGGTRKKIYQDLSKDFSGMELPSWTTLTGGFIRGKGYKVDILDANVEGLTHTETAEAIKYMNPKLTGIVVYGQQANTSTPTMIGVKELCKEIKGLEPERKIILSGWHPSALPEKTLREEECDFVGQGEGFYTYLELLRGNELKNVPGLWWKNGEEIIANSKSLNVQNLTHEINDLSFDLLPMDKYRSYNWHSLQNLDSREKYASIYTSFGCPYRCNFCAIHANFGERKMRFWEPKWVLNQIDKLVENYNIKNLKINDELFILHENHFMPIVDGLIERNYGLNITSFARVDSVKEKHLEKLKKAGFNWFQFGIESGNEELLRRACKGKYNKEYVEEIVGKIHDAGINLCANFVFGLPGDTRETMQETFDLASKLKTAFPSFFCAMAAPGSDLYNEALEKNLPLPETWSGYAQQGYDFLPLRTEELSAEDILKFRDEAFNIYFRNPEYHKMIEKKFGVKAKEHVKAMSKYDLKRKILEK